MLHYNTGFTGCLRIYHTKCDCYITHKYAMCITLSVPLFKGSNLIAKVIIYLNNYICASFSVLFSGSV